MIKNPIIFIGTGRSGTTFVSGAILSHPELGFPSNYQHKFPKSLSINLLRRLYDNNLWRFYTRSNRDTIFHKSIFLPAEAYNMWRYLTKPRINFSQSFLFDERATVDEKKMIEKYFKKMLDLQGKERLALKITGPSRIGYLLSVFPDAHFVYVKRRIIPTVSSFMKTTFWESRGKHKLWFQGAYSEADYEYLKPLNNHPAELTAFQLGRMYAVTKKEIENIKPKIYELDYDDFLSNPDLHIKNILQFTALSNDDACFNYIAFNGIRNNIKADEAYYNTSELKFLYDAYENGLQL
jgi:hypothetical protein